MSNDSKARRKSSELIRGETAVEIPQGERPEGVAADVRGEVGPPSRAEVGRPSSPESASAAEGGGGEERPGEIPAGRPGEIPAERAREIPTVRAAGLRAPPQCGRMSPCTRAGAAICAWVPPVPKKDMPP